MVHATPKSQVGFKDLPLDHGALLDEIRSTRDCEECHCQVLSEVHEAAVQRLIQYSRDNTRGYANARFLNLTETGSNDDRAKSVKCQSEVTAHEAMRSMVEDLAQALEKQNIDMTVFKPNQFATLSVYYARSVSFVKIITKLGMVLLGGVLASRRMFPEKTSSLKRRGRSTWHLIVCPDIMIALALHNLVG